MEVFNTQASFALSDIFWAETLGCRLTPAAVGERCRGFRTAAVPAHLVKPLSF